MDTNFLAYSKASKEALKTANLLQSLGVNVYIHGEEAIGKKTLAKVILPNAPIIDGKNYEELLSVLPSTDALIVTHIENVANVKVFLEEAKKHHVRLVVTAKELQKDSLIEENFSVNIAFPPLRERIEDAKALSEVFIKELQNILDQNIKIDLEKIELDLRENAKSLKKQLLIASVFGQIDEKEIMLIMKNYLLDKLGSLDDYKKFIHLYEVPLIQAGLERFGSQLQLAEKLGLNRNTLRKKILQHKEYLE